MITIALYPSPEVAARLAIEGGEPVDELHLTLAVMEDQNILDVRRVVQAWAARNPPVEAVISGIGRFNNGEDESQQALYASVDGPSLPFMRQSLLYDLEYGFEIKLNHGFTPHITLAYQSPEEELPEQITEPIPVRFEMVSVVEDSERYDIDLIGRPYRYGEQMVRAVRADDGEWVLEVLGLPFGGPLNGKDRYDTFADQDTEFWLDEIGKRAIVYYHGWDENGDENPTPEIIGEELGYEIREDGVWFRVLLDKTKETAKKIWEAAVAGVARASSGALSHLVRINEETGHWDLWPAAEISLMNENEVRYPAGNPYAIAIPAARATFRAAQIEWPDVFDKTQQPAGSAEPPPVAEKNIAQPIPIKAEVRTMGDKTEAPGVQQGLTMEQVAAFIEKREKDAAEKRRIEELEAAAEENKSLRAKLAELEGNGNGDGRTQVRRLPNPAQGGEQDAPVRVEVSSKWDGFSVGQLGLAYEILRAVKAPMSGTLFRALHAKALKTDLYANQIARDKRNNIVREFNPNVNSRAVAAVRAIKPMEMAVRADELHGSDVTDAGDEWVPAYWTPELWDLVRNEARVLSLFRQVEVPGESLTIPTLEGKTTVYKVAQVDDQSELTLAAAPATMSKATTGNVTLTPVKGMAWLGFTEELNEDSIVPVLTTMQMVLAKDLAEQLDEILISGDTETGATNISDYGNGAVDAAWRLLMVNGLRDYALGNSKASDRGTLEASDFTAVMGYIGTNGAYALDPDKLVWIMDPAVYRKALLLGETLTADKAGGVGTFQDGRLQRVFGSDVVVSDKYGLTDTSGYIHNTTGNNTKGSFLLVRPDRWMVGFGRRVRIETPARDVTQIVTDTRHLVASFRVDFKTHSGGNGVGLGYNLTV